MKKCLSMMLFLIVLCLSVTAFAAGSTDWREGRITATGIGIMPSNAINQAQAEAMARRAAVVDAYRNLGEYVEGIRMDAETLVRNNIVESDVVKTKVSAVIKNAVVIEEKQTSNGSYIVTVEMPLYGTNGLASAIFEANKEKLPFPSAIATDTIPLVTAPANGYTGLVIDCRELGLSPVMSPVVYDENSRPIYGYDNLDYEKIIRLGMVDYETDINNHRRAGSNPLVVKAISLIGHDSNPVISDVDANYILVENTKSHFLDNIAVVFVL